MIITIEIPVNGNEDLVAIANQNKEQWTGYEEGGKLTMTLDWCDSCFTQMAAAWVNRIGEFLVGACDFIKEFGA